MPRKRWYKPNKVLPPQFATVWLRLYRMQNRPILGYWVNIMGTIVFYVTGPLYGMNKGSVVGWREV